MISTIALVGLSGAGKSKVGRTLAALAGVPLVDVDADVVRRAGRSIADIFAADGEAAFRRLEADAAVAALAQPGVVSLGGGAPMIPAVADALRTDDVHVVWLRVSTSVAAERVSRDDERPLLSGAGAEQKLDAMLAARGATYAALADQVVDADSADAEAKAAAILAGAGWAARP